MRNAIFLLRTYFIVRNLRFLKEICGFVSKGYDNKYEQLSISMMMSPLHELTIDGKYATNCEREKPTTDYVPMQCKVPKNPEVHFFKHPHCTMSLNINDVVFPLHVYRVLVYFSSTTAQI